MRLIDKTDFDAILDGHELHPMLTTENAQVYFDQEGIDGTALLELSVMLAAHIAEPGKQGGLLRLLLLLDDDLVVRLSATMTTAFTLGWEAHKRAELERRPMQHE